MTDVSRIELGVLGLDRGAHLLLKRALRQIPVGAPLQVFGSHEELAVHLRAWCRAQGHELELFRRRCHRQGAELAERRDEAGGAARQQRPRAGLVQAADLARSAASNDAAPSR